MQEGVVVHEVLGVVAAQGRPRAQGRGPETVGIEPVGIEAVGIERGRDAGELAEAASVVGVDERGVETRTSG